MKKKKKEEKNQISVGFSTFSVGNTHGGFSNWKMGILFGSDVDIEAQFSINQSRADEITMREDYGNLPMTIHDDGFGDIGFDADGADFIRDDVDTNIDVNNHFHLIHWFKRRYIQLKCCFFLPKKKPMQEHLISDDLDLDDRALKEPVAGTSRSMHDLDGQQMLTDDGFGGGNFGRKCIFVFVFGQIPGNIQLAFY